MRFDGLFGASGVIYRCLRWITRCLPVPSILGSSPPRVKLVEVGSVFDWFRPFRGLVSIFRPTRRALCSNSFAAVPNLSVEGKVTPYTRQRMRTNAILSLFYVLLVNAMSSLYRPNRTKKWVEDYLVENGLTDTVKLLRIYEMSLPRASAHHTCYMAPVRTLVDVVFFSHLYHHSFGLLVCYSTTLSPPNIHAARLRTVRSAYRYHSSLVTKLSSE